MADHTPGPWEVRKGRNHETILSSAGHLIAEIVWKFEGDEVNKANGRLIAAAPDLLSVLTEIIADMSNDIDVRAAVRGRRAIRKALEG